MTPRALYTEVSNLVDHLLAQEVALHSTVLTWKPSHVGYIPYDRSARFIFRGDAPSVEDYVRWATGGDYLVMLFDGALLQVDYEFAAGAVIAHRLAYVPCPYDVDPDLLVTEPVADVLEMYMDNGPRNVLLRAGFRFDFDEANAAPGHPAAHFTFNSNACRIPCKAPLRLARFAQVVFGGLYPKVWERDAYLRGLSSRDWSDSTLLDEERQSVHLSWS